MKAISIFRCAVVIFIFTMVFTQSAYGQASEIKARMKARLPDVVALKASGVIGENSKGLLAYVTGNRVKPEVVDAENKDRVLIYGAIARQQGTTADVVGALRGKQIAEKAKSGDWLQDDKGQWSQK